jgi:hypothetical protein
MVSDACRTTGADFRTTLTPSGSPPSASKRALNVTVPEPATGSTLALTAAGSAPVPKTLAVNIQAQPSAIHATAAPPKTVCEMFFW